MIKDALKSLAKFGSMKTSLADPGASLHEHVAGMTLKHFPTDTPKAAIYDKDIEYRFNAQGFRCDNDINVLKPHTVNMYLGCSTTLGTGVNLHETWCQHVNDRVGGVMLNMGQAGGAVETCYRLAAHWIPLVKPRAVYMLSPPNTRREFWASDNEIAILGLGGHLPLPKNMVSEQEIEINRERVTNAINFICQTSSIPFHYTYLHLYNHKFRDIGDFARDGQHAGPNTHKMISEYFK